MPAFRRSVPLEKAYRLLNHGPTVLVSASHDGVDNVMAAAWACALDFDPPKVTVVLDKIAKTLGLIGESGCGKSLTALALMGLLPDGAKEAGAAAARRAGRASLAAQRGSCGSARGSARRSSSDRTRQPGPSRSTNWPLHSIMPARMPRSAWFC